MCNKYRPRYTPPEFVFFLISVISILVLSRTEFRTHPARPLALQFSIYSPSRISQSSQSNRQVIILFDRTVGRAVVFESLSLLPVPLGTVPDPVREVNQKSWMEKNIINATNSHRRFSTLTYDHPYGESHPGHGVQFRHQVQID